MIKRIGIALAALLTLFALTTTPASATPGVSTACADKQWSGVHADLPSTLGLCAATPFEVESANVGDDNLLATVKFYKTPTSPATPCDPVDLVATIDTITTNNIPNFNAAFNSAIFYSMT